MRLLNALRARLFGDDSGEDTAEMNVSEPDSQPEPTPTEPAVTAFLDAVPGRQERAAVRILDDEGLRGDLTDDEFQPLLDWAMAQTDRAAAATASQDDQVAGASIDAAVSAIREVLRAAQDVIVAHAEGRTDDRRYGLDAISQVWKPSLVGGDDTDLPRTLWQPLQRLADHLDTESDLPGAEVAAAIVAALSLETTPSIEATTGDGESES